MSNSFFMPSKLIIFVLALLTIFISCFFIPVFCVSVQNSDDENGYSFSIGDSSYIWPTPGYTSINSPFGKRTSPTSGASSYHKGIDIGAPQGSKLIAVTSGEITFTGFLGGGGYTITLTSGSMKFTYCHVSPNYIVQKGDMVQKGQVVRICWTKKRLWSQG